MSAGISRRMIFANSVVTGCSWKWRSEVATRAERVRQRAAVDELELAAERHAVRQARRAHAAFARDLAQVVRGGLALDRGVGREDQLLDLALAQPRPQLTEPKPARAQPVERPHA